MCTEYCTRFLLLSQSPPWCFQILFIGIKKGIINRQGGYVTMEIIIALIVVVVFGAMFYFNRSSKTLDINSDGKVDLADAKAALDNTVSGVKKAADADGDGKVTASDVKVVAKKAKAAASKTVAKAKATAKTATKAKPKTAKVAAAKPKTTRKKKEV